MSWASGMVPWFSGMTHWRGIALRLKSALGPNGSIAAAAAAAYVDYSAVAQPIAATPQTPGKPVR